MEKETGKEKGDEDIVKESEKERGDLASASPLAILRPPKLQTHSFLRSDSPFPSTNSAVLLVFLKIKNPNH